MASNINQEKISEDLTLGNATTVPSFSDLYGKYVGTETEKKTAADQTLRDLIKDELISSDQISSATIKNILDIVTISVAVAKQGLCSPSIPFIILGDVLDCFTLDACDVVFQYVEVRVGIWKSTVFYTAGKNYLLRMCNDLLRRLSQSKNTVFCGRIQLFLARLFPLSEKSALNLVSQFNLENVTIFNKDPSRSSLKSSDGNDSNVQMTIGTEAIQLGDSMIEGSGIVDYKLYQHIWNLQDIFRYPVQCYTKELWDNFTTNADSVFRVFASDKLEDVAHSRSTAQAQHSNRVYFSKFLTSEKLMNLQLNDGIFRRQILTQFLILFRYLTANVKFKGASLILTEDMKAWINDTEPKIFELLSETPPNGKRFANYIKHLVEREEYWITWKNEGCPSFMKTSKLSADDDHIPNKKRKLETNISVMDEFVSGRKLGMGSPELTRLWSLSPDNLAACQSAAREFLPSLQDYFLECVEQEDPKNAIEAQYKNINKSNFQWKALRLLSHRSQLFFTSQPTTMQFKTVPDYLSTVITKLAKDFPVIPNENGVNANDEGEELKETQFAEESKEGDDVLNEGEEEEMDDDDDSNILDETRNENTDAGSASDLDVLTSNDITIFATKIASNWKKLAPQFNLKQKDIKEIEEDSDDVVLQARQTLVTWQDLSGKGATMTSLSRALKSAGLESIAKDCI